MSPFMINSLVVYDQLSQKLEARLNAVIVSMDRLHAGEKEREKERGGGVFSQIM